nr:winged helix-turn-helix transcriptional regulator [Mycolicibacterium sp.]
MRHPPAALHAGGTNAIGRMLGLLGDEWNLLIIQQSVLGARRYGHFAARLPISHAVLTNRLRVLTGAELLAHRDGEYLPTARSRSLWPMLMLIWEWERTWVPDHAGLLPAMCHARCGQGFSPVLRCGSCQRPATPENVDLTLGPSGARERSAPVASTRRRAEGQPAAGQAGLFPETMSVLGNRWAAALLLASFLGTTRFTDFQSQLGIPPTLLAERLKTFGDIGVLRGPPTTKTQRGVYLLTDKGRAFFGVLLTAVQWAHRWFATPDGPAVVTRHTDCGRPLTAELACGRCGRRLIGAEVTVRPAEGSESP